MSSWTGLTRLFFGFSLLLGDVSYLKASPQPALEFLHQLYKKKDFSLLISKCSQFLNSHSWDQRTRELVLFFLLDSYFQKKNYTLAIEKGYSLIESYPYSSLIPRVLVIMGQSYYLLGYPINATSHMFSLIKKYKKTSWTIHAFQILGDSFYQLKEYKKASQWYDRFLTEVFRQCDDKINTSPFIDQIYSVFYRKILSTFKLNQFEKSLAVTDRALQTLPDLTDQQKEALLFLKIGILKKTLHFKEALTVVDTVLKTVQKKSLLFKKIFFEKINLSMSMQQYQIVRNLMKQYEQYNWSKREKEELSQKEALSFFYQKQYDKAIAIWQKLIDTVDHLSHEETPYLSMGLCHYNLGQYSEAIHCFETILKRCPHPSPRSYYYNAWAYMASGEKEKGIALLYEMLKTPDNDPLKPDVMLWLADHYSIKKETKKQKSFLQGIIQKYPHSDLLGDSHYKLALLSLTKGDENNALNELDQIHPHQSIFQDALLTKMNLYLNKKEYQKVIDSVKKNTFQNPSLAFNQNTFYLLGQSFYFLKKWTQASEYLKKSMYGQESSIITHSMFFLAKVLFHQKLYTESLNMFIKAQRRMLQSEKDELYFKAQLGISRCFEKLKCFNSSKVLYSEMISIKNRKYQAIGREFLALLKTKISQSRKKSS